MSEDVRARLEAATGHAEYGQAMKVVPNTWIRMATVIALVMLCSVALVLTWYPWNAFDQLPGWFRFYQLVSFVPMVIGVVLAGVLLMQSLSLEMLPTRRVLAIADQATRGDGFHLRLTEADGTSRRYRCRRAAATAVKLGLVGVVVGGDAGVAVLKGDTIIEWTALPPV